MKSGLLAPLRRRTSPIGIDVGASGVRAAQLRRSGSEWQLMQLSRVVHRSTDAAESGKAPVLLHNEIANCIAQGIFQTRNVVMGLHDPDIEFHALTLPDAVRKAAGAEHAIRHEIEHLMTFDSGEIEARHWNLPSAVPGAPSAIGIAAKRASVQSLWNACSESGLCCVGIDAAALANARFASLLTPWTDNCLWGVLDVGARRCRLVLSVGDTPVLVRSVAPGSANWTQRISEALKVSGSTAEVQKLEHGICESLRGEGTRNADRNQSVSAMLLGVLRNDLTQLAAEIKRSYEYVMGCFRGVTAGKLVLIGGGASLKRLPEFLREALGIDIQTASTLAGESRSRLRYSAVGGAVIEQFATAIGLAIPSEDTES